jgi:hypothetical protein
MMRRSTRLGGVTAILLLSITAGNAAGAQPDDTGGLKPSSGEQPVQSGRVSAGKAPTSALAKTDRGLLRRTDSALVDVLIKLDHDAAATYSGTVDGLAATSPSVTGEALTGSSPAESEYDAFMADQEQAFEAELARRVPAATVGGSLRTVYGGVSARVPANQIRTVLAIPNVVAVHKNEMRQPLTDSSPEFIGATSLYPSLGGDTQAGEGVIFGVLDTGAWPEHPSFADEGNLGAPPATEDGAPRECNFGDNPLTPAADPFVCQNKLIGGRAFLDAYLSDPARAAAEPFHTARDSNGHGTHTGSTSAGNVLDSAPVFGVERGPINGIAPGAWVSVYKVCGILGCFESDSAAAVGRAILDGVDVINFSISGGTDPATDPVELAFLDAYAANVFVNASAGNEGPGASTANHLSAWTTAVAASTQTREFQSTLTVTADNGDTFDAVGASITAGAGPLPVVLSSDAPYSNALCDAPAAAGTFTGQIVACERGVIARVEKGFNVLQGGAAGMILYNPTLADIETDNHWLPTVHLADGTDFLAFMASHTGETASFVAGTPGDGVGDAMAAFSSRGPAGNFIKPDISAPGVQILAGHTPFREDVVGGPPGEMFQAIAGTSMSGPHIAGSAILLRALHPDWTPGQVRSAMMTTAVTDLVKEDLTTPADPFDMGAGRVDLTVAGDAGLTFDETATNMAMLANDPVNAVHLNIPSINAPVMPGRIETVRTASSTLGQQRQYRVETTAPDGSTISVWPKRFNLKPGQPVDLHITIESDAPTGQYFGEIRLVPKNAALPALHLPVAFVPTQGDVTLMSTCDPTSIRKGDETTCTITAQNNAFEETTVDLFSSTDKRLRVVDARGADITGPRSAELTGVTLGEATVGIPSIAPGASPAGFIPLASFGVTPIGIGDEDIINFNTPPYVFAGKTYNQLAVDSNGYVVAGAGTSEDNNCCSPVIPSPAPPNGVLAPFWTDLDGTGAPGIYIATLTDGVDTWIVVEWQVNVFGTASNRHFQVWIGINGTEDISYAYDPGALPGDPNGQPLVVGAESENGLGGGTIVGLPTEDLRVTSTAPTPGGSASYELDLRGIWRGIGVLTTEMQSDIVAGSTVVKSEVEVTKRFP